MTTLPTNPRVQGAISQVEAFPEWVHTLAYNLWAFTCNQNLSRVTQLLNDGTYQDEGHLVPVEEYIDGNLPPIDVRRQTISAWKQREDWESRWIADLRALAPALHQKVAGNIAVASLQAIDLIARLVSGELKPTDGIDAKMLDIRSKAAFDILNRSGHLAYSRPSDGTALPGPTVQHDRAIAGKTREELMEMAGIITQSDG